VTVVESTGLELDDIQIGALHERPSRLRALARLAGAEAAIADLAPASWQGVLAHSRIPVLVVR